MDDYKKLIEHPELCWDYIDRLRVAIEQLVKERDAAIADISYLIIRPLEVCKLCAHDFADTAAEKCPNCSDITAFGNFEWRGVQNE